MIKNEKGQSTVEFILGFIFAVSSLFLFLKMAINYTDGFMVHHATYMASRTYLVADLERQDVVAGDKKAFDAAKRVFDTYLPQGLIANFNGELKENNASTIKYPAYVGVWVEFQKRFSAGIIGGKENLIMRSESFLGREPSKAEALEQTCEAIKRVIGGSQCDVQATLDDNGA